MPVDDAARPLRPTVTAIRLAAAPLCCLPVACASNAPPACDEFSFSRTDWGEFVGGDLDTPTPRQRVAEAMIECRTLERMSRAEVHGLLGVPDVPDDRGRKERWLTGPAAYGVDYEELTVRYDGQSRVASVTVIQG
jgi:hypothetical protein